MKLPYRGFLLLGLLCLSLGLFAVLACTQPCEGCGTSTPITEDTSDLQTKVSEYLTQQVIVAATAAIQAEKDANATAAQKFYDSGGKIPTYDPYQSTPTPIP